MGEKGNRYEEVGARCPDLRLVTVHLTVRPSAARMFHVAFAEGLVLVHCVPECVIADGVVFSCLELFPACVPFFRCWVGQQEKVA